MRHEDANYFDYDNMYFNDDLAQDDRREQFWAAGKWKPVAIGLMGLATIGAAIVVPANEGVYANWLIGVIAGNVTITTSGNRAWERVVAATAAIWLFISGYVRSLFDTNAWQVNDLIVGVAVLVAAGAAFIHLRRDRRERRPHAL